MPGGSAGTMYPGKRRMIKATTYSNCIHICYSQRSRPLRRVPQRPGFDLRPQLGQCLGQPHHLRHQPEALPGGHSRFS